MKKLTRIGITCSATLLMLCTINLRSQNGTPPSAKAVGPVDWTPLLPAGTGRDYASALCGRCHTTAVLVLQRRSRSGWKNALLGINAARETGGELCACIGGPIEDDEIEILSSYLSEAFGPNNPIDQLPLNMNNASMGALLRLPGIDASDARKVVEYRKKSPFKALEEVEQVLGRSKFGAIKDFVDVKESNFRTDGLIPM